MNIQIIRPTPSDVGTICRIENACFPEKEAASPEQFKDRLNIFPDGFFMAIDTDRKSEEAGGSFNGVAVGFIDGACVNSDRICDEMFENASLHDPLGKWAAVYGLCVIEEYRNKGVGGLLIDSFIEKAKREHREGVILTCKEEKINFYKKFGFLPLGISKSVHGGAVWYDMMLNFIGK